MIPWDLVRGGGRMMTDSYGVVTVTRDDGVHLQRLGTALVRQVLRPAVWLIVNDGSRDRSSELIEQFVAEYAWVESLEVERVPTRARGARVAGLVSVGFAALSSRALELVAKVDSDVSFAPDYFERLVALFRVDPRLGIASGARHEYVAGCWRPRRLTGINVEAQCRLYRRELLEQLVPFEPHAGWDGVDVVQAHLGGWRTEVDRTLAFRHHRLMGDRDGTRLKAWMKEGRAAWAMHYRPSYLALRTVYKSVEDAGAAGLLLGYVKGWITDEPRCGRPDVIRFIRSEQRLRYLPRRRREIADHVSQTPDRPVRVDIMLAAVPGGHLAELWAIRDAWAGFTSAWFTLPSAQSDSLLHGEQVIYGRGPTTRSKVNLIWNLFASWKALSRLRPRIVLASGSGLTVPVAWTARLFGAQVMFLECGGRVDQPSLSFRLLAPIADRLYVQSPELVTAHCRARYVGSVPWLRSLTGVPYERVQVGTFVTVGTEHDYAFDRLLRALDGASLPQPVVVQRGTSALKPSNALIFDFAPQPVVEQYLANAKLVIAHAGIGSVMNAVALGRDLIVMPRSSSLGEAVDDHQQAFARELQAAGITVVDDAAGLHRALQQPRSEQRITLLKHPSRIVSEIRSELIQSLNTQDGLSA